MRIVCGIWLMLTALVHAAALDFPKTLTEVHAAADAGKVTADFEFTNRSEKPVSIARYDSTCSCMSVKIKDGKLQYAPGESGVVRTEFDMGNFSGTVDKVVALWLDGDPAEKPSVSLTVRVHIPVLVALEPKTLKWELAGEGDTQVIRIEMNADKPIRVLSVNSSNEAFKTELKTIKEGKTYELAVTPVNINNPALGVFRVETDCPVGRHRIQQAFGVIRKNTTPPAAKP